MRNYIIRRLLLMVPTLLLVTIIVFFSVRFIPGHVIELMATERYQESEMGAELTTDVIKKALGLDVPVPVQYGRWLRGVVSGDLGDSLWSRRPVLGDILQRLPVSFEIGLIAIITGLLIAMPVGVYSAIRQDTAGDYIGRTIAILAICLPSFWLGTMVVVYPSIWWNWTPAVQYIPFFDDPGGNLAQFAIPGVILGMVISGTTMRMTRTMMLEVLRQDYIRTAWSKGLSERTMVLRHALRNALIPVVTVVGLMIPVLVGGTVVLEEIFALPGIGRLFIKALSARDYPIISGVNLVFASVVLLANLVIDVTYVYLDPRIRYQ